VAVTHGIVSVQAGSKEVWLRAGERWPAALAPAAPTDAAAPEAFAPAPGEPGLDQLPADSDERVVLPAKRPAPRARPQRRVDPSLARENRAFAAAMARRNAGELSQALSELERWLDRYPDSVLQQEARVEQFRLLARLGRSHEAARAARSYLGDYPDGYAREEARDLVLGSP
jgi:TolA-binding protein